MQDFTIKICPACDSKERKFFAEKNGCKIFRCLSCRTLFLDELPGNLSEIYGQKYFWGASSGFGYVDYDADKEPMKNTFIECLNRLEKFQKGRKLLDIGAATGYFLKIAKGRGWQVSGVEIGDEAAKKGRQEGLDIMTGTIADMTGDRKFDVVTMFDVIEHVRNPRVDLEKVRQLLAPDGLLLLITPDSGSFYARLLGKRWHLIVPPEHINLFNRKSLSLLLRSVGFEILEIKLPRKSFTVEYIIHTLFRWQKFGFWDYLLKLVKNFPALAEFRLPINLGDNMMILAIKRA